MAGKAKAKDTKDSKDLAPLDIDALIEAKLKTNRDELRKQVLQETFGNILKNAAPDLTLEGFLGGLKQASKEVLEYAHHQPLREIAEALVGGKVARRRPTARRARTPKSVADDLKNKVTDFLKGKTDKFTVGQISKSLAIDSAVLKKPIADLRKAGTISSEGDRRSMVYFIK